MRMENSYLILGECIIALFDEVLNFFHPFGEWGSRHLEKRPSVGVVFGVGLVEPFLVLLELVKRTVDIRIDPHDQRGVHLDPL